MSQLGTSQLTWRRLQVLLHQLPMDSALHRSVSGDDAGWGLTEHLLAAAVDALHAANWQRGGDPKAPRPRPIPRPGIVPRDTVDSKIGGDRVMEIEEARSFFAARRAAQAAAVRIESGEADGDDEGDDA